MPFLVYYIKRLVFDDKNCNKQVSLLPIRLDISLSYRGYDVGKVGVFFNQPQIECCP